MGRTHLFLSLMVVMGYVMMGPVNAVDHNVGGTPDGWAGDFLDSPTLYQDWAKTRTFVVGDRLVFEFLSEEEILLEVHKKQFDECNLDDYIAMYEVGPTIELTKPGDRYFISGLGYNCQDGKKFGITVIDKPGSAAKSGGLETTSNDTSEN